MTEDGDSSKGVNFEIGASIHKVQRSLQRLKKNLKEIGNEHIRPHLEVDDNFKETEYRLKKLERDRQVKVRTKLDEASRAKTESQLKGIQASRMNRRFTSRDPSHDEKFGLRNAPSAKDYDLDRHKVQELLKEDDGKFPVVTGFSGLKGVRPEGRDNLAAMNKIDESELARKMKFNMAGDPKDLRGRGEFSHWSNQKLGTTGGKNDPTLRWQSAFENFQESSEGFMDNFVGGKDRLKGMNFQMRDLNNNIKHVGQNFKKYSPNIMMWWKVVAMLMPGIVALKVHMMGLKIAIYGVAGAAAALVGGGLVGWGEQIEDSFALAERQINEVKRELFQVLRPALQEFAPISRRFFAGLPGMLQPLVDELRQLTVFENTIFNVIEKVVGYADELINVIISHQQTMENIILGIADWGFDRIVRFMTWLLDNAEKNSQMMENVMSFMAGMLGTLYEVLRIASFAMAALAAPMGLIQRIVDFISNSWLAVVTAAISSMFIWVAAVNSLIKSYAALKSFLFTGWLIKHIKSILTVIGVTQAWNATLAKTLALLASIAGILTLGLAPVMGVMAGLKTHRNVTNQADTFQQPNTRGIGGTPNRQMGTSSPTYNTEVHIDGEASTRQVRELEDTVERVHGRENDVEDKRRY